MKKSLQRINTNFRSNQLYKTVRLIADYFLSLNKIKFRHNFVSAQVFGLPSSTGPLGFPNKVCDRRVAAGRTSGVKPFFQIIQLFIVNKFIPDRSRPGLATTTSGVAQQGTCGNYATAKHSENKSRNRGGRRVKRQREMWKGRRSLIRVGSLNIGTMTGRRRELADMMEQRNVDILCLQETKWRGSKARNIGGEHKLFYNDERKNRIGIVVRKELAESILEVKRVSDGLKAIKLEVNGSILNIVSAYAPQFNNSLEEK